jgi:hypothetical protein
MMELPEFVGLLHDKHHMMRRKKCNDHDKMSWSHETDE